MSWIAFLIPGIGLLGEPGETQHGDVAFHRVAHDALGDDVAGKLEIERLGRAFAHHGDFDLGADRPLHLAHGFVEADALHRLAVELDDVIVGEDTGLLRGGVVDGRDDLDHALFHGDLDAEAAELA